MPRRSIEIALLTTAGETERDEPADATCATETDWECMEIKDRPVQPAYVKIDFKAGSTDSPELQCAAYSDQVANPAMAMEE